MEKNKKSLQKVSKIKNKKSSKKEKEEKKIENSNLEESNSSSNKKDFFLKRINALMLEASLNPKKEWLFLCLIIFLLLFGGIFLFFQTSSYLLLFSSILLSLVVIMFFLMRPKQIIEKRKILLREEFVRLFSFFRLFYSNGRSVYVSLEEVRTYSSGEIGKLFDVLLEEIDEDKSITPYLNFSSHFESLEIRQVMIAIYELSLDGGKDHFYHFESVFQRISTEKRNESFDRFKNKLANLNFLPLIGSAFSMGLVAIAVIALMENSIYGL